MPRASRTEKTRQLFASIREDLYLAARAKAAELRIPLREFIELALENTLSETSSKSSPQPSVWDDEYLNMQAQQPIGAPIELTEEEAQRVAKAIFASTESASENGLTPADEDGN